MHRSGGKKLKNQNNLFSLIPQRVGQYERIFALRMHGIFGGNYVISSEVPSRHVVNPARFTRRYIPSSVTGRSLDPGSPRARPGKG